MNRVATIPLQNILASGIQRAQHSIATSQEQLATGKKVSSIAALGSDGIRILSAHTLAARQTEYEKVSTQIGTQLSLYDAHIDNIDTVSTTLRSQILTAVGTGNAVGLQDAIESSFGQIGAALNASVDGVSLFGGSQTDGSPFTPTKLADMAGLAPAAAFTNDNVRANARVGDNVNIQYGITASDVGTPLMAAFRTLADASPIGNPPTALQTAALTTAIGQLDQGLTTVHSVNAGNGRNQAQADTMATRASDRVDLLNSIISRSEDADLGQIAIDLAQNKSVLQASYSVFSQLSGLSLGNYLK